MSNSITLTDGRSIRLPLHLKNNTIEVKNLGYRYTGIHEEKYWRKLKGVRSHPFPVGYSAIRKWGGSDYQMKVIEGRQGPIFEVIDLENNYSYKGNSCTKPWTELCKQKKNKTRISGPLWFGFTDETLIRILKSLPTKEKLERLNRIVSFSVNEFQDLLYRAKNTLTSECDSIDKRLAKLNENSKKRKASNSNESSLEPSKKRSRSESSSSFEFRNVNLKNSSFGNSKEHYSQGSDSSISDDELAEDILEIFPSKEPKTPAEHHSGSDSDSSEDIVQPTSDSNHSTPVREEIQKEEFSGEQYESEIITPPRNDSPESNSSSTHPMDIDTDDITENRHGNTHIQPEPNSSEFASTTTDSFKSHNSSSSNLESSAEIFSFKNIVTPKRKNVDKHSVFKRKTTHSSVNGSNYNSKKNNYSEKENIDVNSVNSLSFESSAGSSLKSFESNSDGSRSYENVDQNSNKLETDKSKDDNSYSNNSTNRNNQPLSNNTSENDPSYNNLSPSPEKSQPPSQESLDLCGDDNSEEDNDRSVKESYQTIDNSNSNHVSHAQLSDPFDTPTQSTESNGAGSGSTSHTDRMSISKNSGSDSKNESGVNYESLLENSQDHSTSPLLKSKVSLSLRPQEAEYPATPTKATKVDNTSPELYSVKKSNDETTSKSNSSFNSNSSSVRRSLFQEDLPDDNANTSNEKENYLYDQDNNGANNNDDADTQCSQDFGMSSSDESEHEDDNQEYSQPIYPSHDLPLHAIQKINNDHQLIMDAQINQPDSFNHSNPVISLSFSSIEPVLCLCTRKELSIWQLRDNIWTRRFNMIAAEDRDEQFIGAKFSTCGGYLILGGQFEQEMNNSNDSEENHNTFSGFKIFSLDDCIRSNNLNSVLPVMVIRCGFSNMLAFCIAPSKNIVLCSFNDGSLLAIQIDDMWTREMSQKQFKSMPYGEPVKDLDFVPDRPIFIGISNSMLGLWKLNTEGCKIYKVGNNRLKSVSVLSMNQNLRFIMLFSPFSQSEYQPTKAGIFSIVGNRFECESILSANTTKGMTQTQTVKEATCMSFSHSYLIMGTQVGKSVIYNFTTQCCVGILVDHNGKGIHSLRFHNNLPLLAIGGADGSVCIYKQNK
eukprot:gb/GECH01013483.1/.p1 GENE.gb/GECH01013483.1/~~gb/GECH01013483.1/.p1  ORF type:complete len:1109 (+),score=258.13 gb/GECH01013483.1/:1-3327(+)